MSDKPKAYAWLVWCPPTDECDCRIYFTSTDAEVADDEFRNAAVTDEDDADRRTQGFHDLILRSDADATIAALTAEVERMRKERDSARARVVVLEGAAEKVEALFLDMRTPRNGETDRQLRTRIEAMAGNVHCAIALLRDPSTAPISALTPQPPTGKKNPGPELVESFEELEQRLAAEAATKGEKHG